MLKTSTRIILVIFCACLLSSHTIAQKTTTLEEYKVYSDLLKNLYGDIGESNFVIEQKIQLKTFDAQETKNVARKLSLNTEIIKSFNEQNQYETEVQNQFNLKSKVFVIGKEIDEILKPWERDFGSLEENNWKAFRQKYQTLSLLTLSRVGFNKKEDKALVVLGSQEGWTGGDRFFYLMVKKDNSWKIKKKLRAWIS